MGQGWLSSCPGYLCELVGEAEGAARAAGAPAGCLLSSRLTGLGRTAGTLTLQRPASACVALPLALSVTVL